MVNRYREALGFEVKSTAEDGEKAVAYIKEADDPWDNRIQVVKRENGKI